MANLPRIQFTHAGIHCTDVDNMVEFYCRAIGFVVSDKGIASTGHRIFFLTQDPNIHHQLVLFDGRPADLPFNPINQLSFLLNTLDDLKICYQSLLEKGVKGIGQVDHGNAWSIYFKDPEGNPIEMYVDSPFYTHQPCREPLDLSQNADQIRARTKAMCESRPDFKSRDEWIRETTALIRDHRIQQ